MRYEVKTERGRDFIFIILKLDPSPQLTHPCLESDDELLQEKNGNGNEEGM